ncbi:hypothetical protein FB451DRAFT_1234700 [Mycena latifolia]|nr:hypothetical protein FB451DRAFT_1234700 [Mycena latifolia]
MPLAYFPFRTCRPSRWPWHKRSKRIRDSSITIPVVPPGTSYVAESPQPARDYVDANVLSDIATPTQTAAHLPPSPSQRLGAPHRTTVPFDLHNGLVAGSCPSDGSNHANQRLGDPVSASCCTGNSSPSTTPVPATNEATAPTIQPVGIIPAVNSGSPVKDAQGNIWGHTIENLTNIAVQRDYNEINIYSSPNDGPASSSLPEVLYRNIQKDSQHLLPILGVAIAFLAPPSVLQISRVLGRKWTDVRDALEPISSSLHHIALPIGFAAEVKLPQYLENFLRQRTEALWVDLPESHALLARWCLTQQTRDPRDIIYAGDHWVDHVCHSPPSAELYEALRTSGLRLARVSRARLGDIICWLEKQNKGPQSDETQAHALIKMYREYQSKPAEPIPIAGGMFSFLPK